ncbi:hypothetical protein DPMN_021624 [Dreissena polymorpha]|uniref:C2H2-type domain-containing protein n=1 Tax=Dreissena polymorpha TaxID=45954 RepID=A0A9D4SA42_DREPO|nr:hypothetical protein DPMN_021624 [Dreissena polymorpha]
MDDARVDDIQDPRLETRKHQCEICLKLFMRRLHLENHMRVHTGDRNKYLENLLSKPVLKDQHRPANFSDKLYQIVNGPGPRHLTETSATNIDYSPVRSSLSDIGQSMPGSELKMFSCEWCGKTFCRRDFLARHMVVHTGEKPFECHICLRRFNVRTNLNSHTHEFTQMWRPICSVCNRLCPSRRALMVHMCIHTGERPHACQHCEMRFTQKNNLKRHMQNVHRLNKILDPDETPQNVASHQDPNYLVGPNQHFSRKHVCPTCGNGRLLVSLSGIRHFRCPVCPKLFPSRFSLLEHSRTHTGERPFQCDICEYKSAKKGNLTRHMLTVHHSMVGPIISKGLFIKGHHDSMTAEGLPDLQASMDDIALRTMKYLCPFCAKPFPSKGALAMHERVHTGEKPFECECWNRIFKAFANSLDPDETWPHGSYRYGSASELSALRLNLKHICQYCSKPMSSNAALERHIRIHTGEKPFACTVCDHKANTKGNLKIHMLVHSKLR